MNINELKKRLKQKKIGCALFFCFDRIIDNPNFDYFSGFDDIGALIVFSNKPPVLLVPEMSKSKAKSLGIRIKTIKKPLFDEIKKEIGANKKVGIDGSNVTYGSYSIIKKKLKKNLIDVSDICQEIRMIKTPKEIQILKKAFSISDRILDDFFKNMRRFKTEIDAANFLKVKSAESGCDLSFPPIVASGKNSANVHHVPENSKIVKGFLMVDFGIKYKGYCTDTTRMAYIGVPTQEHYDKYKFIRNLQEDLVKNAKKGIICKELSKYCDKGIGEYKMIHSLGHGVGLLVHEGPSINSKDNTILKQGMVITIEPGIYLKGKYGIRIEDTILITDKNPVILSKISKKLRIIRQY